jgi:hypothetical protein
MARVGVFLGQRHRGEYVLKNLAELSSRMIRLAKGQGPRCLRLRQRRMNADKLTSRADHDRHEDILTCEQSEHDSGPRLANVI